MSDTLDLPIREVPGRPPITHPCTLCGEPIEYRAVFDTNPVKNAIPRRSVDPTGVPITVTDRQPSGAHLQFRAWVDLDGQVWVPLKRSHSDPDACPDPPPETAEFWHDDVQREAWKADSRETHETRRRQAGW